MSINVFSIAFIDSTLKKPHLKTFKANFKIHVVLNDLILELENNILLGNNCC